MGNSARDKAPNPKSQKPNKFQTPSPKFQSRIVAGWPWRIAFRSGRHSCRGCAVCRDLEREARKPRTLPAGKPALRRGIVSATLGAWCLEFIWDLVFEVWSFRPLRPVTQIHTSQHSLPCAHGRHGYVRAAWTGSNLSHLSSSPRRRRCSCGRACGGASFNSAASRTAVAIPPRPAGTSLKSFTMHARAKRRACS